MKVKVDVTQEVKSRTGGPILNAHAVKGEDASKTLLRDMIINSVDNTQQQDIVMAVKEKLDLDELAMVCQKNDVVELEIEDWAKIKARIGSSLYSIAMIGEACRLMSPDKDEES